MVLETAINGRADAISTFNERDFRPIVAPFRCSVVRPGEVVRGLKEKGSTHETKQFCFARTAHRKAAESEGVALNQLITLALAEKVSARRTEEYLEERARRSDPAKVSRILARIGKGNPPIEGDELRQDLRKRRKKT